MVEVIDPKLGETILDPACGTGGFLVETYKKLEQQCHTVEDMEVLQKHTIFGGEAKPQPYMLAQMNLLCTVWSFRRSIQETACAIRFVKWATRIVWMLS